MFILMVATFGSYPVPSIFLNQLYEVSYLHGATIILPLKRVNGCHAELLFNDIHGLPRLQIAGVNDDRLADADAGEDFCPCVCSAARCDGLLFGLAVLDGDDLLDSGEGDDGARRDGDGCAAAV